MGSINNKIKKPIISIGFDKKGKLISNIDLNKMKKFNLINTKDMLTQLTTLTNSIKNSNYNIDEFDEISYPSIIVSRIEVKQYLDKNIKFYDFENLTNLNEIEHTIRNNMKLKAVKLFKETIGCGIIDGKNFVEWYADKINYTFKY